jgi:glutamate racemase
MQIDSPTVTLPLPTSAAMARPPRIGVFDSGVGGLSVLKAIRATLPAHPVLYFADSAHAPYGERGDAYVLERCERITQHLLDSGCRVVVIACNTATAVAADALRARWPAVTIVGVEPGIKPAVLLSKNRCVGVLATRSTLESRRFIRLLTQYGQGVQIVTQASTGLALAIESGDVDSPEVLELVDRYCTPLKRAGVDTVVLGCTHYAFVRHSIERAMGLGVVVMDTAQAVAKEVERRMQTLQAHTVACPDLRLESSGDATALVSITRRWLATDANAEIESASNLVPGTGVEPVRPFSGSGGF